MRTTAVGRQRSHTVLSGDTIEPKKYPRIRTDRASFNVTLPREIFDKLEAERGLIPRSRYVNALFKRWLAEVRTQ